MTLRQRMQHWHAMGASGTRKGLSFVAQKFNPFTGLDRLPKQGSIDIEFVSDFSVSEEKTSVRYLAKFDVQFKPKQVRDL